MQPEVICPIELMGEHARAIGEGKARPLAVLVYYPEENQLVVVGMDTCTGEETDAILKQFVNFDYE